MYLTVNKSTDSIIGVQKNLDIGELRPLNGSYVVPIPQGSRLPQLTSSSYILNAGVIDSGSVVDMVYKDLLNSYPMFSQVIYNPLITSSDIGNLDLAGSLPDGNSSRVQTGRVGAPSGCYPNTTSILPVNSKVSPSRPGVLLTRNYDLTDSPPLGAGLTSGITRFAVWFHIVGFATSTDVRSSYGATANQDEPSIRYIKGLSQTLAGFSLKVSVDGGNSFETAHNLQIFSLCDAFTQIKLAFVNNSSEKVYLAGYAILV